MDSVSASTKNAATGERPKPIMSKPVRIHELLGLPKSAGKATEQPRSEPVRPKYLLEAMRSCERQMTNYSVRRTTIAPGTAGKVRRQLHLEPADQTLSDKGTTSGESQSKGDTSIWLLGNVDSARKPIRLGLSKSDGKAKTNHQRLQPVRPKFLMESWEKSQSVKQEGQKSTVRGPRLTNARRKLYNGPSPAPPKNVARKSLAANKFHETTNTPYKAEKVVKPNPEKSAKVTATAAQKRTRKSCLLPPNSIRDQHIGKQTKETIVEESPSTLSPQKNPVVEEKAEVNVETALEIREITTIPEALSTPRIPRVADSIVPPCDRNYKNTENARPQKNQQNLTWIRDNLKHCIRITEEKLLSMRQMLKVTEDMIENNTEPEEQSLLRQENTENCIPAKTPKIVIEHVNENEDSKTKVATDEPNQIFKEQRETNCEENLSVDAENEKENEDSEAQVATDEPNQIFVEQRETNGDENLSVDPENKENVPSIGDEVANDEQSESGGKPRRRSARLAAVEATRSPSNSDDSFTLFESELNITHAKTKTPMPLTSTSAKRNKLDTRSKRSIREYMLIKSSAKFLQTPDQKGLPTPRADRTGTPAERRAMERALSRQLLNQLNDLYDDSLE